MAQEVTLSATLTVLRESAMAAAISKSITDGQFDMSANAHIVGFLSVLITATAIPLGAVTAPHWAWFKNLDTTNFIKIRNGSSGADLIKLKAGEACAVPLYDSATPYAIADTATCSMEYAIFSL